jgi:hypothetical protein
MMLFISQENTMRKVFTITFILFFVFTFQGYAQQSGGMQYAIPGVNHIILEYGEQLNLTDEQKTELLAIQPDRRQNARQSRFQGQRTDRPGMRSQRNLTRERTEQTNQRPVTRPAYIGQVYEILSDEQGRTLQNLLIDRVNHQLELQTMRHQEIVSRAGIDAEKAELVLEILNRQSRASADIAVYRIENPGESVLDKTRELAELRREGLNEMKEFLTVAEFENLNQNSTIRTQGRQSPVRRFMLRSR